MVHNVESINTNSENSVDDAWQDLLGISADPPDKRELCKQCTCVFIFIKIRIFSN